MDRRTVEVNSTGSGYLICFVYAGTGIQRYLVRLSDCMTDFSNLH